jgi:hypothetical protein
MARDPLADVVDAPLFIVPRVMDGLRAYRASAPPGALAALAATLLAGIEAHPTKFWVMKQFQKTLERAGDGDAAAGDQLGGELEKLMDILGIASSDGVLGANRR